MPVIFPELIYNINQPAKNALKNAQHRVGDRQHNRCLDPRPSEHRFRQPPTKAVQHHMQCDMQRQKTTK